MRDNMWNVMRDMAAYVMVFCMGVILDVSKELRAVAGLIYIISLGIVLACIFCKKVYK